MDCGRRRRPFCRAWSSGRQRRLHAQDQPRGDHRRLRVDVLQRPHRSAHPRDGAADRHAGQREAHARRRRVRHRRGAAVRPRPDRPERGRLQGRHERRLLEDGGGTDYNDAFAAAARAQPNATGRIFLTDGEHTAFDPYANGHAGGPPDLRDRPRRRRWPAARATSCSTASPPTPAGSTGAPTTPARCRPPCSTSTARSPARRRPSASATASRKVGQAEAHIGEDPQPDQHRPVRADLGEHRRRLHDRQVPRDPARQGGRALGEGAQAQGQPAQAARPSPRCASAAWCRASWCSACRATKLSHAGHAGEPDDPGDAGAAK